MYVYMNCGEDVLNERFYVLENYLIFGVSYFFYDCVTMYMVYRLVVKLFLFGQSEPYCFTNQ